jgi:hypothetical protein
MTDKRASKQDRLKSILRGAFAGSPTPLKDIPKKDGEVRGKKKPRKRRAR